MYIIGKVKKVLTNQSKYGIMIIVNEREVIKIMNTVVRMNTVVQTTNLAIQSANGTDLTLTHVLIIVGGGLVVGGVLIAVVNWLLNR